jgi:hypothetical protein
MHTKMNKPDFRVGMQRDQKAEPFLPSSGACPEQQSNLSNEEERVLDLFAQKTPVDPLQWPTYAKTLSTLEISKALGFETQRDVNPLLYRMQKKGLILNLTPGARGTWGLCSGSQSFV